MLHCAYAPFRMTVLGTPTTIVVNNPLSCLPLEGKVGDASRSDEVFQACAFPRPIRDISRRKAYRAPLGAYRVR